MGSGYSGQGRAGDSGPQTTPLQAILAVDFFPKHHHHQPTATPQSHRPVHIGHMAPGPSGIDPQTPQPGPAFAAEDDQGATFVLTFDGDDDDCDTEPALPDPSTVDVPDLKPASFLRPESASLLSPLSASFPPMAYEDGPGPAPAGVGALKNPFNFQTQVISTSPVKSVPHPAPSTHHAPS